MQAFGDKLNFVRAELEKVLVLRDKHHSSFPELDNRACFWNILNLVAFAGTKLPP
jgi:hypothetical protein